MFILLEEWVGRRSVRFGLRVCKGKAWFILEVVVGYWRGVRGGSEVYVVSGYRLWGFVGYYFTCDGEFLGRFR